VREPNHEHAQSDHNDRQRERTYVSEGDAHALATSSQSAPMQEGWRVGDRPSRIAFPRYSAEVIGLHGRWQPHADRRSADAGTQSLQHDGLLFAL
jgi:hypothetical protein